MSEPESLIAFPCDFPIKVMGEMHDDFAEIIVAEIHRQLPDFDSSRVEMRASSGGKYISLTCTVHVTSKLQLDNVYRALSAHPMVKITL